MAVAPLQIALAQRALGDAYFAFLAVLCAWFFLESLRAPQSIAWLVAYGFAFSLLVMTKENAAFVCVALMGTWICFLFARTGWPISFALPLVTFIAGALAVIILASLLGGLGEWITFYRMYAAKSADIPYVVQFQGGAWYRYLVDFTLLSPVIVALVFGRIFNINKESQVDFFCALLLGFSFVAMSAVSGGMSLRFAAYWDFPLRWLAASQVLQFSGKFRRIKPFFALAGLILMVVAVDLFQYWRYFVHARIYDPVTFQLFYASGLFK
jgi:4-amino-4-deoxy-L-arabinose transferase-like glycosyltransferase